MLLPPRLELAHYQRLASGVSYRDTHQPIDPIGVQLPSNRTPAPLAVDHFRRQTFLRPFLSCVASLISQSNFVSHWSRP